MSYSEHLAKVVSDQMNLFATMGRRKVAGHLVNLDFWLAQSRHALKVIDGHEDRLRRLKTTDSADMYKPMSEKERLSIRHSITDSTYQFLLRCYRDQLLTESQVRDACRSLSIRVDAKDLKRTES